MRLRAMRQRAESLLKNCTVGLTRGYAGFTVVICSLAWMAGCAPITPLPGPQTSSPSSGLPGGSTPSATSSPGSSTSSPGGTSGGSPAGGNPLPGGASGSGGAGPQTSYEQSPSGGTIGSSSGGGGVGTPGGASGGQPGGDQGSGSDGGNAEQPSWEEIAGADGSGGDGEWDTSNEQIESPGGGGDIGGPLQGGPEGGQDDEFEGALEEMDGEILAELEIARESQGGGAGIPTPADASVTEDSSEDASSAPTAAPRSVSARRANVPVPPPPRRGAEQIPEDIPDAKDDDIIARQLREAAMQEQDPELKEKLWEEYKKYKKG